MKVSTIALILSTCLLLSTADPQQGGQAGDGRPGGSGGQNGLGGPSGQGNSTGGSGEGNDNGNGGGRNSNTTQRGDDSRPRNWGAVNARNETEFDDRKSPRKVAFLGKSANVRIYPNYSDTSVFLQLRFGRIVELDAAGQPLPGHQVASLAQANDAVSFIASNRTIGNVSVSFVNVTLKPAEKPEFRPICGKGSGADLPSAPPAPPAPSADLAPRVSVELLFGLEDVLKLQYGSENVTVPRNGLKWAISYANWPFCNTTHALLVSLDLLLPANAVAEVNTSGGLTTLTLRLGTEYNASLSFLDYALDGPTGSIKIPANVTVLSKEADGESGGSRVTVNTVLPNPKPYAASSVWYDPISATTSVYLSSADPGNGYIPVTTSGSGNTTGGGTAAGAAAGLRMTFWAALAAIMLSVFLMS